MAIQLSLGDRVRLSGGYDLEPRWLRDRSAYLGTIRSFIPGQNQALAAVIELDDMLHVDAAAGRMVVLELRYVGATWTEENIVHVELCDFIPEAKQWQARRKGAWVESNATCSLLLAAGVTSR